MFLSLGVASLPGDELARVRVAGRLPLLLALLPLPTFLLALPVFRLAP